MELVIVKNDKTVTTSLMVAEYFGKQHAHVLRDIKSLLESKPDLGLSNFGLSSYTNSQNKEQPMYEMDKDGFTLLCMGFTGERALDFKLAYIKAFNEMESMLRQPLPATTIVPVGDEDRKVLAATNIMESYVRLSRLFKTPEHLTLSEGVKQVRNSLGIDLTPLLQGGSTQDRILEDDVFLEVRELGRIHGIPAQEVNKILEHKGFQTKGTDMWIATDLAAGQYFVHQWTVKNKSGYNLKWRRSFIASII
jgi:Rha family phage regulatory protein